jgi:hypothetical protein
MTAIGYPLPLTGTFQNILSFLSAARIKEKTGGAAPNKIELKLGSALL